MQDDHVGNLAEFAAVCRTTPREASETIRNRAMEINVRTVEDSDRAGFPKCVCVVPTTRCECQCGFCLGFFTDYLKSLYAGKTLCLRPYAKRPIV
jgi:hypothetical protein